MPPSVNICKLDLENEVLHNCIIIGNEKEQRDSVLERISNKFKDDTFQIVAKENETLSEIDQKINTVKYRQNTLHDLKQKELVPKNLNEKCVIILDNVSLSHEQYNVLAECQDVHIIILISYHDNNIESIINSEMKYSHIIAFNDKNKKNRTKVFNAFFRRSVDTFDIFDKIMSGITSNNKKSSLVVRMSDEFHNAQLDDKICWYEI